VSVKSENLGSSSYTIQGLKGKSPPLYLILLSIITDLNEDGVMSSKGKQ